MLAPGHLEILCRQLSDRGWYVTAAEKTDATVLVGFNFLPGPAPTWLKAFEVPHKDATVEGIEAAIAGWMAQVRHEFENGTSSPLVRQMIAEHGPDRVKEAMRGRANA